jgi:hypothetical protein
MSDTDTRTQVSRILGFTELKNIVAPIDKAVYLSRKYMGEKEISLTTICKYFNISRWRLKLSTWSVLTGYTDHSKSKTRYLAPKYEGELAEKIIDAEISHKSMTKDEILDMVM